jgi:hypothetical protein
MARISVVTLPPLDDNKWSYEVEITESDGSGSRTTHQVTMLKDYYMDLTQRGRIIPEELIKKSFEFLLDRESKDSILQQFDIAQIKDYFPEYEKEIKKVLNLRLK